MLDRHGQLTSAVVESVTVGDEAPSVRLFTSVGDVLLAERAVISVNGTRSFAREIVATTRTATRTRVEIAGAEALAARDTDPAAIAEAARTALYLLDRSLITVPRSLSLDGDIKDLLDAAEVSYVDISDNRWSAFSFDRPAVNDGVRLSEQVLRDLMLTTRWGNEPDTSRTTISQRRLRLHLLMAIVGTGRTPKVAWLPGYLPVEARVEVGAPTAYASVSRATSETARLIEIELASPGSIINGLVIVAGSG